VSNQAECSLADLADCHGEHLEWHKPVESSCVRRGLFALVVAVSVGALLGACARPTPTTVAVSYSPTSLTTPATSAPEEMPTAAPLWTPTSQMAPSPAAREADSAQAAPSAPDESQVPSASIVAIVNGTAITRESYDQQVAQAQTYFLQQPGQDARSDVSRQGLQELQKQVLDWMIDQVLIEQAAESMGIAVSDAMVEAQVSRMQGSDRERFEKWLAASGLTPSSLRQQLRIDLITSAVRDRVTASVEREAEQIHVRHMLVSDQDAAQSALERLRQGQDFAVVARDVSEDGTTRASGGDLGFLPRGVMPPAFEEAAFALEPGEISDLVRSDFGFHIIQVVEIEPEHPVSDELWPVVQQRVFENWLAERRAEVSIRRNPPTAPSETR